MYIQIHYKYVGNFGITKCYKKITIKKNIIKNEFNFLKIR